LEHTVQSLLSHESRGVQKLTVAVSKMLVEASEAEFRRVELRCLESFADRENSWKASLYINQMLAIAARNESLSDSLVKFAQNVVGILKPGSLLPAPILCLRELFLANKGVQEELEKLNTAELINDTVMTSLKFFDPHLNGVNGKPVNGKTKVSGVKNGLKNGQSKASPSDVCEFLEVSFFGIKFGSAG